MVTVPMIRCVGPLTGVPTGVGADEVLGIAGAGLFEDFFGGCFGEVKGFFAGMGELTGVPLLLRFFSTLGLQGVEPFLVFVVSLALSVLISSCISLRAIGSTLSIRGTSTFFQTMVFPHVYHIHLFTGFWITHICITRSY